MLTESARILSVEPDRVWVSARNQEHCHGCSARGACGHGLLNAFAGLRHNPIPVRIQQGSTDHLEQQDQVMLGIDNQLIMRLSLALYGIPILGLLVGSGAGLALTGSDLLSVFGGILGLCLGLYIVRFSVSRDPSSSVVLINQ